MENLICVQCGTQFDASAEPPPHCTICKDERQFVRYGGQQWTTLERLASDHHNNCEDEALQLLGISTEPEFAIGQRALLLQSPGGNLLWDCISLLDEKTIAEVNGRGGIRAIAISHPHFIRRWSNGPSILTRKSFCMLPTANGSCAKAHVFNFGKEQPSRFGMASH